MFLYAMLRIIIKVLEMKCLRMRTGLQWIVRVRNDSGKKDRDAKISIVCWNIDQVVLKCGNVGNIQ